MRISVVFRRVPMLIAIVILSAVSQAATCPFDRGGSDAVNDGVVLTRYALGITGAPLVASTRYASLDPLQVKNNIECVGCALDMNGDNAIDAVDTTIVARHLAGLKGSALTAGLNLGTPPSASRPDTASITSFLANGCAIGGAINAFVQGGNAFGAPAVLGTTDAQPLTVRSGGSSVALKLSAGGGQQISLLSGELVDADAPLVVSGSSANDASVRPSYPFPSYGSTISGGGSSRFACFDWEFEQNGGSCKNQLSGAYNTIAGGVGNLAIGQSNTISGGAANLSGNFGFGSQGSVVSGGTLNHASANYSVVGGGKKSLASGEYSAVSGGEQNTAGGFASAVPGGRLNRALGDHSIAAGYRAVVQALHHGSFVWADQSDTNNDFASTGENEFNVRAAGGFRLHASTSQFFGAQTRQMLNLWGTQYGIGVQLSALYFRSPTQFVWFIGGSHCDAPNCAGAGGTENMRLTASSLLVNGAVVQGSDRGIKENFASISPKAMLAKVASLPISLWNYKADDKKTQHIGPMAQDFKRLFDVGQDDKTIAMVDAAGVALAAIQGLHTLVKEKNAEIAALKKKANRVDQLEREMAVIKKRLGM